MNNNTVTIFRDIYSKEPVYISVDQALERIRIGRSKDRIDLIRKTFDKDKAKSMKKMLPCVRFSGKFKDRTDNSLEKHSGFIVLDFDEVEVSEKMPEILSHNFVYAAWLSPSGNGIKALVKIADGSKHRQHFEALKDIFPDVDHSGINESRICYESFDPHITINKEAVAFTTIKEIEVIHLSSDIVDYETMFQNLLKWITNRGDAFVTGERNIFLFKLAAACCRFGIPEDDAIALMLREFHTGNTDCSEKGFLAPIHSAYKANRDRFATAKFEREILIDKETKKEIDIQRAWDEADGKLKDVVYGIDMKDQAMNIFDNGYPTIQGLGIPNLDELYKPWRGEISALFGHGNYGKSAFAKWYQVYRAVVYGEKIASFAPEDKRQQYYHELTEILLGQLCHRGSPNRTATREEYSNAYDWISAHFFYVYPEELAPTPTYIKERFLELIIKEGVSWCVIDPFNQMENDYSIFGDRDDRYLSTALADFRRFAVANNIFFLILGHPKQMQKDASGNYPEPDYYNYAGGAMWVNKMDNILVYHRPYAQTLPDDPTCMFYSKKIKDQIVVGKKGFIDFTMNRSTRRFIINGRDYLAYAIKEKGLDFKSKYSQGKLI